MASDRAVIGVTYRETPAGQLMASCHTNEEVRRADLLLDSILAGQPHADVVGVGTIHWTFKTAIAGTMVSDGRIRLDVGTRAAVLRMALARSYPEKRFVVRGPRRGGRGTFEVQSPSGLPPPEVEMVHRLRDICARAVWGRYTPQGFVALLDQDGNHLGTLKGKRGERGTFVVGI